jgi:diguanylate cyclase (GGDEF)-like protein
MATKHDSSLNQDAAVSSCCRELKSELENARQLLRKQQLYFAAITDNSLFSYEINITRNTASKMGSFLSENDQTAVLSAYTDIILNTIQQTIHPQDVNSMLDALSPDKLLQSFSRGQQVIKTEYRRINENGYISWIGARVFLIQDPGNSDICGFFYLNNIDERKKNEIALIKKAELDSLTGLYNRSALKKLVEKELQNPDSRHALLVIDLDNFKNVNDTHGHLFGDKVLQRFAYMLRKIFRKADIVGRIGGDEFIVFMTNTTNVITATRAEEICHECKRDYLLGSADTAVTPSIGISFYPEDGNSLEKLYQKADSALYISKNRGKNRFTIYNEQTCDNKELDISSGTVIPLHSKIESGQWSILADSSRMESTVPDEVVLL